MFHGYTHRSHREDIGQVADGDYEVYLSVHPDDVTHVLVTLSPDEARLLGLKLIRCADKAEVLD